MMTSSSYLTLLILIFTSSLLSTASHSQTTSPSLPPTDAGTDCTTLLFGAADCLTYVEEGSNLTVPDKACCPELKTLVNTNPICLCDLLKKGGNSLGIVIDIKKAIKLPSACKVQTPDPTLCSLINGSPTGAPTPTPTDGLPPSPTEAILPPSTVNNDNDAAAIGIPAAALVMALFVTSAVSLNVF